MIPVTIVVLPVLMFLFAVRMPVSLSEGQARKKRKAEACSEKNSDQRTAHSSPLAIFSRPGQQFTSE
jgi:hypothetical protein